MLRWDVTRLGADRAVTRLQRVFGAGIMAHGNARCGGERSGAET